MKKIMILTACLLMTSIYTNADVELNFSPNLEMFFPEVDSIVTPTSLVASDVDVDALISIHNHFSFGPTFQYANNSSANGDATVFGFGARAEYLFNGMDASGVYAATEANLAVAEVKQTGVASCSFGGFTNSILVGYAWRPKYGISIKFGAGLTSKITNEADGSLCTTSQFDELAVVAEKRQNQLGVELTIGKSF